jgi:hypothetical protein
MGLMYKYKDVVMEKRNNSNTALIEYKAEEAL